MGFINNYPYTDFHELNLDWILKTVKSLDTEVHDWLAFKSVKFADPIHWNSNENYTDNTIVLSPEGNSYISKKFVPVGISLNNDEYWLLIGDYNAQIGEYSRIVERYTEIVQNINDNLHDPLYNRKFIFVGDSYIMGYANDGHTYTSFARQLIDGLGLNGTIIGDSGAGFVAIGDSTGRNFLQLLQTYTGETSDVTDIMFLGGFNDRNKEPSAIYNNILACREHIVSTFPRACMHVGMIAWSTDSIYYKDLQNTISYYRSATVFGYDYITGIENMLHNSSLMTSDGVHPNNVGHAEIANGLANYILGSKPINICSCIDVTPPPATYAQGSVSMGSVRFELMNDVCSISSDDTIVINLNAITQSSGGRYNWLDNWVEISDVVPDRLVNGSAFACMPFTAIWANPEETGWFTSPASLRFKDGKFAVNIKPVINNGIYDYGIKYFHIPPFTMTLCTRQA